MSVQVGAGKSVSLKLMAERNIVTYGCSAFFIDVEGEYAKLVQKLGGKTIKIRQGESTGINPFELEKDYKGNREFLNIMDKVADIRALLSTIARNYMGRTLNGTEITEIEIVVNQSFGEPVILADRVHRTLLITVLSEFPNRSLKDPLPADSGLFFLSHIFVLFS